jgi:hypothetical protein
MKAGEYLDMPLQEVIPAQPDSLKPENVSLVLEVVRNINSIVIGGVSIPLDPERLDALMGEIKDELERLK